MSWVNRVKKLDAGQKSPGATWRFLRSNDRLRTILEAQWRKSGLPLSRLAELIDVASPNRLSLYFANKGPAGNRINELQIVKLCDVLGVEIDLDIKIVR
jgi:hypothetical protein